jgi:hypothetical protein
VIGSCVNAVEGVPVPLVVVINMVKKQIPPIIQYRPDAVPSGGVNPANVAGIEYGNNGAPKYITLPCASTRIGIG